MRIAAIAAGLAAGFLAVTVHQPGHAASVFARGADLLRVCQSKSVADQAYCLGYVAGFADVNSRSSEAANAYCLKPTTAAGDLRDAVVKRLKENPASQTQPAFATMFVAFGDAFPCTAAPVIAQTPQDTAPKAAVPPAPAETTQPKR